MQPVGCKLTGDRSPFVKAHVIPKAFTKRVWPQVPLMESDGDNRPIRRWSGWYDSKLVCQRGEDILARYDDYGYKTLEMAGLLVRGDRPRLALVAENVVTIPSVDIGLFRLFGLSLLWRAAISKLPAFKDIQLPERAIGSLREAVLTSDPGKPNYHPIWLSCFDQVDTENVSPYHLDFESEKFARFFLDGVIMYIGYSTNSALVADFGNIFVGNSNNIHVVVVPYAGSDQQRYHSETANQIFSRWGDPWNRGRKNG